MNIKNRIFKNIRQYKKPNEKEFTATQLRAFEILNKKPLTADEIKLQKVYEILTRNLKKFKK